MCPYLKTYFMHVVVTVISYSHILFKVVATNPSSMDQNTLKDMTPSVNVAAASFLRCLF